ncbi:hypothetical protein AAG906_005771 [Vitis piasezkii]
MKLNPSKCAFGVSAGKFLGFMVTQSKRHRSQPGSSQGKGATTPHSKLVALGRFIARFIDELRPFFLAIRKAGPQGWTDIVKVLWKKLIRYVSVLEWAISAVLFRCPSPKERNSHPVIVLTDQPLRSILHKPDLTGRMLQWAIELSEFGIEFQPRLSKKGQVMADFVLEYSRRSNQHHESKEQEWWTLQVDGASRSSGSGVGLVLQSPTGEYLEQAIRLGFSASNNEAEYEAILSGLDLALRYPSPHSGSTTHNLW